MRDHLYRFSTQPEVKMQNYCSPKFQYFTWSDFSNFLPPSEKHLRFIFLNTYDTYSLQLEKNVLVILRSQNYDHRITIAHNFDFGSVANLWFLGPSQVHISDYFYLIIWMQIAIGKWIFIVIDREFAKLWQSKFNWKCRFFRFHGVMPHDIFALTTHFEVKICI